MQVTREPSLSGLKGRDVKAQASGLGQFMQARRSPARAIYVDSVGRRIINPIHSDRRSRLYSAAVTRVTRPGTTFFDGDRAGERCNYVDRPIETGQLKMRRIRFARRMNRIGFLSF